MKIFVLCVVLIGFIGCSSSKNPTVSTAEKDPDKIKKVTAKEAVKVAAQTAAKWKSDAILYSISQKGVLVELGRPDMGSTWYFADVSNGASRRWLLEYFSPQTLDVFFVEVFDGVVENSDQMSKFREKPGSISDQWIDSSEALQIARKEIEKNKKINQDKYMATAKLIPLEGKPTWAVSFNEADGGDFLYGVAINAVSKKVEQSTDELR